MEAAPPQRCGGRLRNPGRHAADAPLHDLPGGYIEGDQHRIADADVSECVLWKVGDDPSCFGIYDRYYGMPGRGVLARRQDRVGYPAVDRRFDVGVVEV